MTTHPESDGCCNISGDLLRGDLGEVPLELAAAGFAALWHGRAVAPSELLAVEADEARDLVATLAQQGRAEVDEHGRLVGIHGLTLRTTRHWFLHNDRRRHTWCAFDVIGIPAALRLDAVAHTDCPACHAPLTVEITGGRPAESGVVLWLPAPPAGNLMAEFCATADLYCSAEHLQQRVDTERTPGQLSDLASAVALGCDTWADVARIDLDEGAWL